MSKLLAEHKYDFLLMPHSTNMYDETKEWLSDMEFYKEEILFLSSLINKFTLKKPDEETLSGLLGIADQEKEINYTLLNHLGMLKLIDESNFSREESDLRVAHKKVAAVVNAFIFSIKLIKKEVFRLTKSQLKSIKLNKQINADFEEGRIAL